MRIREIVFILIWLFVGLFINGSILKTHGDPLFGGDLKPEIKVAVKKDSEIKKELKDGIVELKKGLKEGVGEVKQAIKGVKGELESLSSELSKLDFEGGEWQKVSASNFIPDFKLVTKDLEKLASDSQLKDFRISRETETKRIASAPISTANVDQIAIALWNGEITILNSQTGSVEFDLTMFSGGGSESDFNKFAEEFTVTSNTYDEILSLSVGDATAADSVSRKYYGVNGTIYIPEGMAVSIAGAYNDLRIEDFDGKLEIEIPRGTLSLSGGSGDASLRVGTGSLSAIKREGDLKAAVTTGDSRIESIDGHVTFAGGTGKLAFREVQGSLSAAANTGEVALSGIGGEALISIGTGSASAYRIEGDLSLSVNSGSVTAEDISGNTKIQAGTGDVEAVKLGGASFVKTNTGSVRIKNASDSIAVFVSTGAVFVSDVDSETLEGATVEVGTGAIDFALTGSSSHILFANTGSGRIRINGQSVDRGSGVSQTYGDESGGTSISLKTKTGEISISGLKEESR